MSSNRQAVVGRRVFIDMDGVIVDFDKFRDERGLSGDEVKCLKGAYLHMEPIPGAIEAVRSLIGMGFEVWLATKPPTGVAYAYSDKAAWVFQHLPELKRRIIITHDKGLLGGPQDFLCDDRPHKANCERFTGMLLRFVDGFHWPRALEVLREVAFAPPPGYRLPMDDGEGHFIEVTSPNGFVPLAPGETAEAPAVASRWRHTNGREYLVAAITNEGNNHPDHPVTVLYRGDNGRFWSRPLSDWRRSMTLIPGKTAPAAQPELAVWCGPVPESNGRQNWSALLYRKGVGIFRGPSFCVERSEYPDRVRYEADRLRYIIGEIDVEPDIQAYDAKLHSGYTGPEVFILYDHLVRQREWSEITFGPGSRAAGIVDHIRKELMEIEADPGDLAEWIDVAILALDGAWRTGASPQQIIDALVAKQVKNEGRTWPDWRTAPADKAIEHDRSGEVDRG